MFYLFLTFYSFSWLLNSECTALVAMLKLLPDTDILHSSCGETVCSMLSRYSDLLWLWGELYRTRQLVQLLRTQQKGLGDDMAHSRQHRFKPCLKIWTAANIVTEQQPSTFQLYFSSTLTRKLLIYVFIFSCCWLYWIQKYHYQYSVSFIKVSFMFL